MKNDARLNGGRHILRDFFLFFSFATGKAMVRENACPVISTRHEVVVAVVESWTMSTASAPGAVGVTVTNATHRRPHSHTTIIAEASRGITVTMVATEMGKGATRIRKHKVMKQMNQRTPACFHLSFFRTELCR